MTKKKLIKLRSDHLQEGKELPCLFCGSDNAYIQTKKTKFGAGFDYFLLSNYCTACDHEWKDIRTFDGRLLDIMLPEKEYKWSPKDLK